jgi:pimeloyl-ACP methyl ester carboxylesterase
MPSIVASLLGALVGQNMISTSGFNSPVYSTSAGGQAQCVSGYIPVSATAQSEKILLSNPDSQAAVTELFVQYLSANSNVTTQVNGGQTTTSGSFNIHAKLCYPASAKSQDSYNSLLFLIHGIGYDKSYWDLASGFSFVDYAASQGYPTFSYDRLGTGLSTKPDPIQVTQSQIQVQIAHQLIQSLRAGTISNHKFTKIAGAGHSYGSIQSVGIAAQYPADLDAIILQGFSINSNGLGLTFADFNSAIASQNQPLRFGLLPSGYLVTDSPISNQFAFFTYPNYPQSLFNSIDAAKQPFSIGDALTLTAPVVPTSYTGPVNVVLGDSDLIFCQGNCYYPVDQAAVVQGALFPAANVAGSASYLVQGTGHAVNAHNNAPKAFAQMIAFVKNNGI